MFQAQFLFLFGQDDKASPPQNAKTIIDYLVNQAMVKPKYEVETLAGVGHLIELPNSPPTSLSNHVLFPRNQVIMGGSNIKLHSVGQLTAWRKILDFFQNVLC